MADTTMSAREENCSREAVSYGSYSGRAWAMERRKDPACPIRAPPCGFCSGSGQVAQLRLDGSAEAPRPCGQCGARAKQRRRG